MPDTVAVTAIVATLALVAAAASTMPGGWPSGVIAAIAFMVSPLLWSTPPPSSAFLPLPFVAGWLFATAMLLRRRELLWAALAGGVLGAGVYASTPSLVMMAAYAVLTIAVVAPCGVLSRAHWIAFAAAFVIGGSPLLVRWAMSPSIYREIVVTHHLYDANRFNVYQGVREVTSWVGLTARSEVFWDYLNPAFLFVTGRVLSWPLAILLPIGIYYVIARDVSIIGRVAFAAFVASPLAASLPAEPPIRSRIAWILPAAAMLTACGVEGVRRLAGRRTT